MRTTLNVDATLIRRAAHLTGVVKKTALVRLGLEALIVRESARRLAKLGGSEPWREAGQAQAAGSRRVILVDTSVWVDHLRVGNRTLQDLLERADVLSHAFVVGELASGRCAIGERS